MKKLHLLLLVVCIGLICLVSCGDNNKPDEPCNHTGGTATCTAKAVCSECGEEYGEINPENHGVSSVWTNDNGKHYHACTNGCGAKLDEADCAGGAATCVAKAVCSTCNTAYGELSTTHAPAAEWTSADGKHYHECTNGCGTRLDEADCAGGAATCAEKAICSTCNTAYGELSTTHAPAAEWTSADGKHYHECTNGCGTKLDEADCDGNATCVQAAICSVCNKEHGGTAASNHAPAAEWTTADGKHYHECTNGCGTRLDEAECDGTATCVSKAVCSVCEKEHGDINMNGHNFEMLYTDDSHYEKCQNDCGTTSEPVAHTHGEWKVQTEATEEADGVLESVCICGHKITKASVKSDVLSVKGGASGIVVVIHDDGTMATALTLDALYAKYGLVGDVAMQVGSNGSSKCMDTNTASDMTDDTVNGSVVAFWRDMLATGRWKVDSHSMTHQYWGDGTNVVEDDALIAYEVIKSQEILRNMFPGQRVLTWCYPGFSAQKKVVGSSNTEAIFEKVYSENARKIIEQYYISGRSTSNGVLSVTDTQSDFESQFADTAYVSSSVWNFFPSLSLGDSSVGTAKENITKAAENGGISIMFMHNVVDVMPEDKTNKMLTSSMDAILSHLSGYVKDGAIWNTHYEDAILYIREAQSASVYTVKNDDGSLSVTLTDELDDEIYNYPLTVRISAPEGAVAVKIVQGDRVSYAKVTNGTFDADIVPDGGEAVITATDAANVPEEDTTVAPTPSSDNFNRTYTFDSEYDIYMVSSSITGKVTSSDSYELAKSQVGAKIVGANGGTLNAYKYFGAHANKATTLNAHLSIPGGTGAVAPAMVDISFDICMSYAGIFENNAWNALFQIKFSDKSPITLFMGYDNTKNQWYLGESTTDIYAYFDIGKSYNINLKFLMGDTPTLVVFADGEIIAETTNLVAENKTFNYLYFTGQTRALYDMTLDNVSFKSYDEIKEFCRHEMAEWWTTDGVSHSKSCSLCNEVILKGTCQRGCGEACITCGYNYGSSMGHSLEWTELAGGGFSASCTRCGSTISTAFKHAAAYPDNSSLTLAKDPAGSAKNVLLYTKTPNDAEKGYNTEFTVTGSALTAKKVNISFNVYVDSVAQDLINGEESSNNYRMVQLYASNFYKPFIGLDKDNPGKWIVGHLTDDEKKTVNYAEHYFDFDKWYNISMDLFLDTNTAILYVDGVKVGSYNGCSDTVEAISSLRFLGQYRCDCNIYFDAPVFTASDSTVNAGYDFEKGLEGVDYSVTHENCVVTPTVDPDDENNTAIKFDRTEKSGSVVFNLPSVETAAEAVTLGFRIRVGGETSNGAELRIMLSNNNATTPYMASIIKKAGYFEIGCRTSATEQVNVKETISSEKFALDSWYDVTITLHISCCECFYAEWTLVGADGVEHKAYSQLYARQDGDETKPETTVSHVRFWAVGNNTVQHHYIDDVTVRAGGEGAANGHHPISKEYTTKDGYHYKTCACCDIIFGYTECSKSDSSALVTNAESKTHYYTCDLCHVTKFDETGCTVNEPTCALDATCSVCKHLYEVAIPHTFEGEVTYNGDATATKEGTVTGFCSVCNGTVTGILWGSSQLIKDANKDVTVSVIGDSITSYEDVSNGDAASTSNSTISGNGTGWYGNNKKPTLAVDRSRTWWQLSIDALGGSLLVNNSVSGGCILTKDENVGAYNTRALQLHDDTGDNAGEEPDIIIVYLGTNDVNVHSTNIGSASDIDLSNVAALREKAEAELTVLESYAIMLDNIKTTYENAEIYCLNVLKCRTYFTNETKSKALSDFNAGVAALAEGFGAKYVDICEGTGINEENMESYIPIYDDDSSDNNYHPNAAGMQLIADCVIETVLANTKYMPDTSEFLALIK